MKKNFCVSIIGLGYVGLPLALRFIKNNIDVYGIDTDSKKINFLKKGISPFNLNKNYEYLKYFKINNSRLSSNYNLINKTDITIICLPTPLDKKYNPDMTYLRECFNKLKYILKPGHALSLESTVYPGATEELFSKIINKKKRFKLGEDFFLLYSPERENPGDPIFSYQKTTKVVSGYSKKCKKIAKIIYSKIAKKIHVTESIKAAEMSKLIENIYRSVNIGLVNEFKIIADKLKIDLWDTLGAARTKNFGYRPFKPGPGTGGHCIPIDPYYLDWVIKKKNYNSTFINFSKKIDRKMPIWSFSKIKKILNKKKMIKKILFLGVSYKKNVDDTRESPALKLLNLFNYKKFRIYFHDPYVKYIKIKNKKIRCLNIDYKKLAKFDAVLITTDHDEYNYNIDKISKYSKIIFDTRGLFKDYKKNNKIYFC